MKHTVFALAAVLSLIASVSHAGGHALAPVSETNGILVNADGMSLYTFDPDTETTSACYDQCAESWPPLAAPEDADEAGQFTTIDRKDGSKQWAYNGQPLYLWVGDEAPGDMTGDGIGGEWHIARP